MQEPDIRQKEGGGVNIKGIIADAIFQRLLRWHPWPWWIGLNVRKCMNVPLSTKEVIALRLYRWAMYNGQD